MNPGKCRHRHELPKAESVSPTAPLHWHCKDHQAVKNVSWVELGEAFLAWLDSSIAAVYVEPL